MWLRLKMIDRSDYTIAGVAAACGWGAKYLIALWLTPGALAHITIQGLVTITLGCGAVVVQHFLRRYLNRNWPDEGPDCVDLFGLFRRGVSRIKAMRRPNGKGQGSS